MKNKWDETYETEKRECVGWYENIPEPSLTLIKKYQKDKNKKILDVGCGETTLLENLLKDGYTNIEGIDFSFKAIEFLKNNIAIPEGANLTLKVANILEEFDLNEKVALWHDRAVFHFFHTESEREIYKNNLKKHLEDDGIFILSCFSKENKVEICNSFLVKKYFVEELVDFFKDLFLLEESIDYEYITPWGEIRKYIYCIFKKIK